MPKNKHKRYKRVKQLPNVIFSDLGKAPGPCPYSWDDGKYQGMKKVLELGCGKGEHTLAFAAADPGRLCIGIDSKSHRICVGAETALDRGLENVLFLHAKIEYLEAFFKEQSIDEIWLTFPDPHLKNRTAKHRLTGERFLNSYAKLLNPGGTVFLKTDSNSLYTYTRESVERWGGCVTAVSDDIFREDQGYPAARDVASAFQEKALIQGGTIKFVAFKLG